MAAWLTELRNLVVAIVGGVITGLVLYVLVGAGTSGSSSGGSSANPPASAAGSCRTVAQFRFDDLGDTSIHVIEVYPGVGESPNDHTYDGTFVSGESTGICCKTSGRLVRSDPSSGEISRASDEWVRLAPAAPTRYATVVYGDISAKSLAALPAC